MLYLDALQLIRKHYNTIEYSPDIEIIKINKLLDFSNYYFVAVLNENDNAIVSDMAKTSEVIEKTEDEWKKLAKDYNLNFDNYTLSTEFKKMEDLYNLIALLDEISATD